MRDNTAGLFTKGKYRASEKCGCPDECNFLGLLSALLRFISGDHRVGGKRAKRPAFSAADSVEAMIAHRELLLASVKRECKGKMELHGKNHEDFMHRIDCIGTHYCPKQGELAKHLLIRLGLHP